MRDFCSSEQDLQWETLTLETGMETVGTVANLQIHSSQKA